VLRQAWVRSADSGRRARDRTGGGNVARDGSAGASRRGRSRVRAGVADFCAAAAGGRSMRCSRMRAAVSATLDGSFEDVRRVIDTNVTGTIYPVQKSAGKCARATTAGFRTPARLAFIPGSFAAVYNGTKAFLDSFSLALRNELKRDAVTVTSRCRGRPTRGSLHAPACSTRSSRATRKPTPRAWRASR
jgi:uncharacterized protein